jgi:cell division transport system permease protein
VQVRPLAGRDMEADIARVVALAQASPGVRSAVPLSADDAHALLEPWLGQGLDLSALPVPRIVVLRLGEEARSDLPRLALRLKIDVPGASVDDHAPWLDRLGGLTAGLSVFSLVVVALALLACAGAVGFAVEGVVATHREVVEVLHFVGARDTFLQQLFSRRFARHGLIGAAFGSLPAGGMVLAALSSIQPEWGRPSPFMGLAPAVAAGLAVLAVVAATWLVAGWAAAATVKRFLNADR